MGRFAARAAALGSDLVRTSAANSFGSVQPEIIPEGVFRLEFDLAVVEQNDTKVSVGARRSPAAGRRVAPLFRLADSRLACTQLPLLLRADRGNAAGLAISFQPHLFRFGCTVFDPRGDCAFWRRALRAGNTWMDRGAGRGRLGAAGLRSDRAHARARIYSFSDCAGGHVVVRADRSSWPYCAVRQRDRQSGCRSSASPAGDAFLCRAMRWCVLLPRAAFLLVRFLINRKPVDSALLWSLIAFFLSLRFIGDGADFDRLLSNRSMHSGRVDYRELVPAGLSRRAHHLAIATCF